jgi:cytochrome c-type biogenesis protein CcmH/NrfF
MKMYRVARDLRMKVLSIIAQGSHSYVVNGNVTHMGI